MKNEPEDDRILKRIYLLYFIGGGVVAKVLIWLFNFSIGWFWLTLIIAFSLYTIEYLLASFFFDQEQDEWWKENFFHTEFNCSCSDCKKERKKYSKGLFRIFSFAMGAIFLMLILPYTCHQDNVKSKEITQEFEIRFKDLALKLRTSVKTEYYEVQKIPNREVVRGKIGRYYVVDLNNAQYQERVLFKEGEYIVEDTKNELIAPMNKFMDEVYYYLDKGAKCELFVKGSADLKGHETFKKELMPEYAFYRIKYLPKIDRRQFDRHLKAQQIGAYYTNSELPNLRAKFLQQTISQGFPKISPPLILEGKVEEEIDKYLRNAFLILFVDFNETLPELLD